MTPYRQSLSLLIALSATMVLLPSGKAVAKNNNPAAMLAKADANRDGTITWEEVAQFRTQQFGRLDRNGDGYASTADKPSGIAGRKYSKVFRELKDRFDTDKDGRIFRTEFIEAPSPVFDTGDIDGDNVLSPDEIAALKAMQPAS